LKADISAEMRSTWEARRVPLRQLANETHVVASRVQLASLSQAASGVGRLPPQPATFRGSVGAFFVRLVRRALFWYSPQIVRFQVEAAAAIEQHDGDLQQIGTEVSRLGELSAAVGAHADEIARFKSELAGAADRQSVLAQRTLDSIARIQRECQEEITRFRSELAGAADRQSVLAQRTLDSIAGIQRECQELRSHLGELQSDMQSHREQIRDGASEIRGGLHSVERMVTALRAQAVEQEAQFLTLLSLYRGRSPETPSASEPPILDIARRHIDDELYLRFEDLFRGPRDLVRGRLEVYLPFLAEHGLGSPSAPVVDLGCGRGEWLELLRDRGFTARGIDRNRAMVRVCLGLGLDVSEADSLAFLREAPSESVGLISAFHVIEHLPHTILIEMLDHCVRLLKPGGGLILETPDPENVLVASHTFYTDLTHIVPLPSSTLRFLVESRGLSDVIVRRLNPYEESLKLPETSDIEKRFNSLFYGPRDYAVLGTKP